MGRRAVKKKTAKKNNSRGWMMGWLTAKPFIFVCALLVVAGVFWRCMVPAVTDTADADGDNISFDSYIIDVDIVTVDWQGNENAVTQDKALQIGDGVKVNISYVLPLQTLDSTHNTITYTVPTDTFQLTEAQSGPVYGTSVDENGETISESVGTYSISKDGVITITFSSEYVQKNQSSSVSGTVRYDGKVVAENQSSQNSEVNITFGEVVKTVTIAGTGEDDSAHDVVINKQHTSYDAEKGIITYVVMVSTTKGTGEYVSVTDTLGSGMSYTGVVSAQDSKGNTVSIYSDEQLNTKAASVEGDTFSLYIGAVEADNPVCITYEVKLDSPPTAEGGETTSYANKVQASTPDAKDKEDTDYTTIYSTDDSISKSGWSYNGLIYWTIRLNQNGQDISGYVLSDDMAGSITGDIVWKAYDYATGQYVTEGTITDFSEFTPTGNYVYTVEYTTSVNEIDGIEYGTTTVTNTGTLSGGGNTIDFSGSVGVTYRVLSKTSGTLSSVYNEDGTVDETKKKLSWTSTLKDLKENTVPKDAVYTDDLTAEGLSSTVSLLELAVTTKGGTTLTAGTDYELTFNEDAGLVTGFTVTFLKDIEAEEVYFTYNTLIDTSGLATDDSRSYVNKASYEDTSGKDTTEAGYTYTKKKTLEKWDGRTSSNGDTAHDMESIKDADGNYCLTWTLLVRPEDNWTGDIVITDTLPDYVEYGGITSVGTYANNSMHSNGGWEETISKLVATDATDGSLKITIPQDIYSRAECIYVTYYGKLDRDTAFADGGGSVELSNSAKLSIGDITATDEQKQTIQENMLSKHFLSYNESDAQMLRYEVIVNPDAVNLTNDENETIIFEDKMSYSRWSGLPTQFSFAASELSVEYENDNGEWEPLSSEKYTYQLVRKTEENDICYYLTMKLPDETKLRVKYAYQAKGHVEVTFSNAATLKGVDTSGDIDDSIQQSVQLDSSGATAMVGEGLKFQKVDANDYKIKVSGAEFRLEEWNAETKEWQVKDTITRDETGADSTTVSVTQGYTGLTTDTDGMFSIKYLDENKPYRLVETSIPEGYLAADIYYFYIKGAEKAVQTDFPDGVQWDYTSSYPKPVDESGYYALTGVDTTQIPEPKSTKALFKKTDQKTGEVLSGAEFALYEWDSLTNDWSSSAKGTFTSDQNGVITVTGIRFNRAYKLVETAAPAGYYVDSAPRYFYVPANNQNVYTLDFPAAADGSKGTIESFEQDYGAKAASETDAGAYVITNQKAKLTVTKTWLDENGEPIASTELPSEVGISIYKTSVEPEYDTETQYIVNIQKVNNSFGSAGIQETNLGAISSSWSDGISFGVENDKILYITVTDASYIGEDWNNITDATVKLVEKLSDDTAVYAISDVKSNVTLTYVNANWITISDYSIVSRAELPGAEDGALVQKVTLNADDNKWTYTLEDIDNASYYYVIEDEVPEGYAVSYSNATQLKVGADTEIVVTNQKKGEEPTKGIQVKKVWHDSAGNALSDPPDSVNVTLYQTTEAPDVAGASDSVIFLSGFGKGEIVFDQMWGSDYIGAKTNQRLILTVNPHENTELVVNATSSTVQVQDPKVDANGNYVYTITNLDEWTTIQCSSNTATIVSFEVEDAVVDNAALNQLITNGATQYGEQQTLRAANSWSYEWTNLPETNDSGQNLYYFVVEESISGYTEVYSQAQVLPTAGATITITNTRDGDTPEPETVEVQLTKKWLDASGNAYTPDSGTAIILQLYRSIGGTSEPELVEQTPDADENGSEWTYTWSKLEKTDENGTAYSYYVKEVSVQTGDTDITNTFTITNSDVVSAEDAVDGVIALTVTNQQKEVEPDTVTIQVNKVWKDASGASMTPTGNIAVELQLYRKAVIEGSAESVTAEGGEAVGDSVTITSVEGWTHTWSDLAAGNSDGTEVYYYYVTETRVILDGQDVTEQYFISNSAVTDGSVELIVENREVPKCSVTVQKVWEDANNADGTRPENITVVLYQNDQEYKSQSITAADNWTYTWSDLPAEDENGTAYVYTVQEEAVPGYEASYSEAEAADPGASVECSLTNNSCEFSTEAMSFIEKHSDAVLHIEYTTGSGGYIVIGGTVNGEWKDKNYNSIPEGSNSIDISLQDFFTSNGVDSVSTVTYFGVWPNNGCELKSVTLSTGSASTGEGNATTITITNTKTDTPGYELPVTGGTGTKRYLWIGIALMLFAGLGYIMLQRNVPLVKSHSTKGISIKEKERNV